MTTLDEPNGDCDITAITEAIDMLTETTRELTDALEEAADATVRLVKVLEAQE